MAKKSSLSSPAAELNGLTSDVIQDVRKNKIIFPIILLGIVIIATIFLLTTILPLRNTAQQIGSGIGNASGSIAGAAVGSVEGATVAIPEGLSEGTEAGLSAEDTVAEISNIIENNVNGLGNLEVLVANTDLTTYHEVGTKYGALYLTRASAVFTVDLSKVTVTHKEGLISIVLPRPVAEIKIDPEETELLADWQKKFFDGSDSAGFEAYLNSFKATKNISEDEVKDYSLLLDMASESAVKQITEIANAVRGNNNEIVVTVSIQAE